MTQRSFSFLQFPACFHHAYLRLGASIYVLLHSGAGVTFRCTLGVTDGEQESKWAGSLKVFVIHTGNMTSFVGSFAFWVMLMNSVFFAKEQISHQELSAVEWERMLNYTSEMIAIMGFNKEICVSFLTGGALFWKGWTGIGAGRTSIGLRGVLLNLYSWLAAPAELGHHISLYEITGDQAETSDYWFPRSSAPGNLLVKQQEEISQMEVCVFVFEMCLTWKLAR